VVILILAGRRNRRGGIPPADKTETRDFDPRYTPGGSPPAVPRGQSPEPTPPATSPAPTTPPTTSPTDEGYASQTGVFDASDPDSSDGRTVIRLLHRSAIVVLLALGASGYGHANVAWGKVKRRW